MSCGGGKDVRGAQETSIVGTGTIEEPGLEAGQVRAILADMGDVLVKIRADRFFEHLLRHVPGVDPKAFYREVLDREAYTDFATGRMGAERFADRLAQILGTSWSFELFREIWVDMMDPMPGAETALARAMAHVPVYILSNTDPVHMEYIRGLFPWIRGVSGEHLSYEVGTLKPDPAFWVGALERFGLAPSGALFLDDRPENVDAAAALGIPSVRMARDGDFELVVRRLWP